MTANKERQKAYRERRSTAGDNGERRLQTWVLTAADLALDRLARHHQVTRKEMLERLLVQADTQATQGMDDVAFNVYMSVTA